MKRLFKYAATASLGTLLMIGLAGCDEPNESPGEKVKEAGQEVIEGVKESKDVGETIDEAGDELKSDESRSVGERVEEGAEETGEAIEEGADAVKREADKIVE